MSTTGSQGFVKQVLFKGQNAIVKESRAVDYTIELEQFALKRINKLNLPHFVKMLGKRNFSYSSKIYLEEIIGDSLNVFLLRKNSYKAVESIAFQVLCACALLHAQTGISHNDLHTSNIFVRKTNVDVFVYKFGETSFAFKTFGYCPVIFDFGYCFVPNTSCMSTCVFSDIGYFPHEPDYLSDARIFLDRFIASAKQYYRQTKRLESSYKKMFGPLKLNFGWFQDNTFLNLIDELKTKLWKNESSEYMDDVFGLFISQMKTPIVPNKCHLDPKEQFVEFMFNLNRVFPKQNKRKLLLLKNIFERPLTYLIRKYSKYTNILDFKREATTTLHAIHNTIYDITRIMSEQKASEYSKIKVKSMIDVIKFIPKQKVVFLPGMKIQIFDSKESEDLVFTLSKEDVEMIYLQDLQP